MKAVIIGAVIQTARPFGRIVALLLFASLAVSAHASSEYLLPANGSGGRSVRYFADHELKTVDGRSEYAVVMVHGVSGGNADCTKRVRGLLKGTPTEGKVFFVAPCFPILPMLGKADEKRIVYWHENKWQAGNDSPVAANLSPYDVLDAIFADLNDPRLYPQLKHVLFCGYSAGAQIVSRYMAVSRIKARKGLTFSFAAGAPSSWLFMDKNANWHYGLGNRNRYAGSLSNSEIFQNIKSRHIVCFCGTADIETKNLSTKPLAMKQGANRYERFKNFRSHISTFEELRKSFEFIEVEGIGHSGKCWNGVNFEKLVLGAKEQYAREAELPRIEALAFKSEGCLIYGQILVPSARFASPRPCAIFCHGFAGFTRWDDVAHDLCRAGIAVVIPHHRGAWGSEGEYTVSGCIRDAENLARWIMDAATAAKYNLDTNAVHLVGHSMGGNSVVNATTRLPGLRGVALVAPCDIGFMAQQMSREALKNFLIGEGMQALHRASDDSIVDDIISNATEMRFVRAAKALKGKKVFLATGEYDSTVPNEPLEEFWAALGDGIHKSRHTYRAGHSLMGARLAFASDLKNFILAPADSRTTNPCDSFVQLAEAVPDAILEIRYYSTYNFVGERIDGYEQPCALLSKEAAKALKAASDDCVKRGYRLKIYDAYRPQRAVAHFVRWADDIGDTRMKAPFYPNLDKSVLFKQGYIAERSGHSRGSTVDLTLFDMKTGKEVDMGGTFDWFGEESHPSYRGITDAQFKNRMLLREIMVAHGFKPLAEEWWHFTLANEPYPDTYFDFPVHE